MPIAHRWARVALFAGLALALSACQSPAPRAEPAMTVAGAAAQVDALQPPAWLERDGLRHALLPGTALQRGDWIVTGKQGRVEVRLEDGSRLRVGSESALDLQQLGLDGNVLWGSLNLVRGDLRFTSSQDSQLRRDLSLTVGGVVSARVQGSDVCGRAGPRRNLICLLEGEAEAQAEGGAPVQLQNGPIMYIAQKGGSPRTEKPAQRQISEWLNATALQEGRPVFRADGGWGIGISAESNERAARRALEAAWAKGLPAQRMDVEVDGRHWHRIAVVGLPSAKAARGFLPELEAQDYRGAWVFRRG